MINKTGIFLPQSDLQSNAANLLVQSVRKTAVEPEIIDFRAPSQLAAALRRADCGFAVIAAPEDIFLKTKIALIKYLDEKTVRSSAITAAIGEICPLGDKEFDLHCAVPVGAKPIATADGLFSAFTFEKNGRTVVMLPLIEEKLRELIPLVFGKETEKAVPSGFRKNLESVIKSGKKTAVASVGLSGALMAVVSSVDGGENAFLLAESKPASAANSADSIANCAKEAKEASGADYGVSVSAPESENGESYMLVCLADSNRARVAKVYAENGETPKALAGAAITKLYEMMDELAGAGALVNPNPPPKPKKNPVLPIIITAIGIATAIVLSLLVTFFIGEKEKNESATNTKAHIQADGLAVYAAQAETTTVPFEEETDFRGGSGIGDEFELLVSDLLTESATNEAATQTVTQPTSVSLTQTAQTTLPVTKPTATQTPQTTVRPTAAPSTKPVTVPATQKPVTTKPSENEKASGTFVLTSYGWGHGVGMSQEGAIAMATNGSDYKQILVNYYPDTTVKPDPSTPETVKYGGVEYGLVEYLCKASYREIGNSAPKDALKAQIIAIYTFAKTYNFDVDSSRHAFSPNWAYEGTATHKACLEVLGMASAEDKPAAVYVDYNGQPAFTCYFASSAGKTASANSVWGGNYAYLSGGAKSPEKVEVAELKISAEDMKKMILAYDSSVTLGDDPAQWIKIVSHDKAYSADIGYASVVRVGNKEIRGNRFRSDVMGYQLRSHCFTIKYIPN